ncbi:MAG: DUF2130 domain-containing protein [bacterium]|nr:DUF2130 domain-containing protein [bacterium]
MNDNIVCPDCGKNIQITQALVAQVTVGLKEEMVLKHEEEKSLLKKQFNEEAENQRKTLDIERERLSADAKLQISEKLKMAESEIKKKIEQESELRQRDIEGRLKDADEGRKKDQETLIALMKQLREKDEREHQLRIESEQKLSEEIKQAFLKAQKSASDQYEMQIKERDKMNDDLRRKIEELQMKATESSVQIRGEIQELEMEQMLRELFPMDYIEPIGKGKFGADISQKVRDQYGRLCGVILWESKHTKQFQSEWLPKLREDLRTYKGNIAVLATQTLPEYIETFGMKDGVWITGYECLPGLATALRHQLIYVAYERSAASGKGEKMEMLYNYLIGHEFKQKIEAIVEVFTTMREDLEKEKIVMERVWKKRDMQLARLAVNTSRMYGEMQGLVGSSLGEISGLELDSGDVTTKKEAVSLLDLIE